MSSERPIWALDTMEIEQRRQTSLTRKRRFGTIVPITTGTAGEVMAGLAFVSNKPIWGIVNAILGAGSYTVSYLAHKVFSRSLNASRSYINALQEELGTDK